MSETSYFFDSRIAKGNPLDYVKDKPISCKSYMNYMGIRLQQMFHYENLPTSIPKEMLEYYLMNNGTCFIAKHTDEKLYALIGSYGGEPDAYYRPTRYIVSNPALHLSKDYNIETDGVLFRNDSLWIGLYPLMSRYASMLSENMVTIRTADIMLRVMAMFTAPDDKTKIAAEEYLKKLEKGEPGVIGENRFFHDGVTMQSPPSNNGSYLTQFIELHQYLIGTFWNEVGLNANYNMKREAIGEGESSLNEDSLLPLCEEMLRCRKEDVEKLNKMFGTEVTVEFDSSWKRNQLELEYSLQKMKNEASQLAENLGGDDGSGSEGDSEDSSESARDDFTESENGSGSEVNTDEINGPSSDVVDSEGDKGTDNCEDGLEGYDEEISNDSGESGESSVVNVEININLSEEDGENNVEHSEKN